MPRKSSVLLVVSLLSIIYFQSTLSKGRRNLSRMRRDTSSAALSPSFRAASFNSVQHQQQQFGGRKQASTKEDNDMWPFQWGTFALKRFFRRRRLMMTLLFSFLSHSRGSAVATRGASWAAPAPSSAPGGPGLSRTEAPDTTTSSQTTQIIGYEEEGEKSLKKWNHVSLVFFHAQKGGKIVGNLRSSFVRWWMRYGPSLSSSSC